MVDTTDPEVEAAIDPEVVTLVQPVLTLDPLDTRLVSVAEYGRMVIETGDIAKVGTFELKLLILSRRFPGDDNASELDLVLNISPCTSVEQDIEVDLGNFSYT